MREKLRNYIIKILFYLSKAILLKYKPGIIAITGSVGKTTTKEAVATILAPLLPIRKSEKSFNSAFGIPLTIIGVNRSGWSNPYAWGKIFLRGLALIIWPHHFPKWLVLEVGTGKPGDIAKIGKWLKPDVVVITRLPEVPAHIEFFRDREGVLQEKAELIKAMKSNGTLILNYDDEDVRNLAKTTDKKVITYGLSNRADLYGTNLKLWHGENKGQYPLGMSLRVHLEGKVLPTSIKNAISGTHVYAGLAALAVAHAIGLSLDEAVVGLQNFERVPGRLSLVHGKKNSMIIDDSYNASPASMEAAIDLMTAEWITGRKIAVLGDMLELGRFTKDGHIRMGQYLPGKVDVLVTVGKRSLDIRYGAETVGFTFESIFSFDNARDASEFLNEFMTEGDVVLIKGSQGMRLEKITESLLENPKDARFLVRQERQWKHK